MKPKIIKPNNSQARVVFMPGCGRVTHLSANGNYSVFFMLAQNQEPLGISEKKLEEEIKVLESIVYNKDKGLIDMFKNHKQSRIAVARTKLIELLKQRKAYELVRQLDTHKLFIGNERTLDTAEITDIGTGRDGEIYTVHYEYKGTNGKLVIPSKDYRHVDKDTILIHGKRKSTLLTLI